MGKKVWEEDYDETDILSEKDNEDELPKGEKFKMVNDDMEES